MPRRSQPSCTFGEALQEVAGVLLGFVEPALVDEVDVQQGGCVSCVASILDAADLAQQIAIRKVIDFIRNHPDDYDAEFEATFHKLVARLTSPKPT